MKVSKAGNLVCASSEYIQWSRCARRFRSGVLTLALLLLFVAWRWGAAQPVGAEEGGLSIAALTAAKSGIWERSFDPGFEMVETAIAPESGPALAGTDTMSEWSRLAHQSFRDGNWEIYISSGDGQNQTRLTFNEAADTQPDLNRGVTRVAFISGRDGNAEVYAMNADGSNPIRLTNSAVDESRPVWSPNGARLAFARREGEQRDIWVMNADGSGQMRLTSDPAPDLTPTWSPDGNRLAWVRVSGSNGAIWVMNADGSAPSALTAPLPLLQHPIWSPDGTRIAFDYDNDGDLWNELMMINSDGTGLIEILDPSYLDQISDLEDAWAAGWSPDGVSILFTRVWYVIQNNELYLGRLRIERVQAVRNAGSTTYLISSIYDIAYDWDTLDNLPPQVHCLPLPPLSRVQGFAVSWVGQDQGPAGIMRYEAQYRELPAGLWMPWISDRYMTSATFPGSAGRTFAFRARAWDYAYNTAAWPEQGDTQTTLYTWQVSGAVLDARAQPIFGAVVGVTPVPLWLALPDMNGRYRVYLQAQGAHQFTARRAGYGTPPSMALNPTSDAEIYHLLPPADDRLVNGGFEGGNTQGWQVSGGVPVGVLAEAAHSGQYGARLGQSLTWPTIQKSPDGDYAAVAYDGGANLHVAWMTAPAPYSVMYRICPRSGSCFGAVKVADGNDPRLAVASNGAAHLTYIRDFKLYYRSRAAAGGWSAERELGAIGPTMGRAALALDPASRPHVVWDREGKVFYSYLQGDGNWSAPDQLCEYGMLPDIAIGQNGDVHVAWGAGGWEQMGYRMRPAGGQWTEIHPLEASYYVRHPEIAVDAQGNAHIVWPPDSSGSSVIYIRRSAQGVWSAKEDIPDLPGQDPAIALLTDGRVIVAAGGQYLSYRTDLGGWSPPYRVVQSAGVHESGWSTALAASPLPSQVGMAGSIMENEKQNVYTAHVPILVEPTGVAQLKQVISLPAGLENPTLSMSYKYAWDDRFEAEQVTAYVIEGDAIVALGNLTPSATWAVGWFDLAAWAGRTITLTLDLATLGDGRLTSVCLDEIAVGSWRAQTLDRLHLPLLRK